MLVTRPERSTPRRIPRRILTDLGDISARTFGEAQIDFDALTGSGQCTSFGCATSRAAPLTRSPRQLKDFIGPDALDLSNCGGVIIRKQTIPS